MTAAHSYDDLHHLVDRLTPQQAEAVRGVILQLVKTPPESESDQVAEKPQPIRQLSFAGLLHSGQGDLGRNAKEIIREDLGRTA
ncbi:MAG: hypothetical protein H0T78_12730 [Longispora sp.]|nr:hypothetical protein [Longispora sp. (in: high G+C Gram-positive bacteria)]